MYKICFKEYYNASQYLILFDLLMKLQGLNKDNFLMSIGISPTSYRRARASNQKIGYKIVKILADYFDLKMITSEEVEETDKFLNKVFSDIYFKRCETIEEYSLELNRLVQKKNLLFPIYLLMILFININDTGPRESIISKNMNLFIEVKKYKNFYSSGLEEIFDSIVIYFNKTIPKEIFNKTYNTSIVYFSLASKCNLQKEYYTSLYFADKARVILIEECNYIKLIYLNLIYMLNYNVLGMYEKTYELAGNQIIALNALGRTDFEYRITIQHLALASIAIEKYNEVIELLESQSIYQETDFLCLMFAHFMTNQKEYERLYNSIDVTSKENNGIKNLDTFLRKKNRSNLQKLQVEGIKSIFVNVLEKNVLTS